MPEVNTTDKYFYEKSGGPKKAIKRITRRRNPNYIKPQELKKVVEPKIIDDWYEQVVNQLTVARNELGLSQMELAQKLHTRQSAISKFERRLANPTLVFLMRYAEALGRTVTVELHRKD